MQIKLIKSTFYNEKATKKKLAKFILKSKFLSMGEYCEKFESSFSKYQGRKYSVLVSSGSAANLLLIQALRNEGILKRGDSVGISALTWATNVMPIIQLGLKPVIIDCELNTLNISSKIIEKSYTKNKIKCLFITNALGFASDIEEIAQFCKKNSILLLEDNCESLGSEVGARKLGNFGVASTFSFYVGHHLSTIEGGMVCTDDKNLYESLVMARAHGWDRNLDAQCQKELRQKHGVSEFLSKYTFYDLAYNLRPTEITGFLGFEQMKYLGEIVDKRETNFRKLVDASKENKDLVQLKTSRMNRISNFAFPLIFKNKELFENYKRKFEKAGVEIRPIIAGNIQKQPFYRKYIPSNFICRNAEFVQENGFYFGNNPEMTDDEIKFLCGLVKNE